MAWNLEKLTNQVVVLVETQAVDAEKGDRGLVMEFDETM